MTTKLIPILILLTVTLASASCPLVAPTIQPVTMPEIPLDEPVNATCLRGCMLITDDGPPFTFCEEPHVVDQWLMEQAKGLRCRARLVDVVRQARAYLGNSRPYLDVGPVEREIRVVGRETLLSEMDTLLKECP